MIAAKHGATFQEMVALLNCRHLPARLNTAEAALLLGFQDHDIAPLIAAKLLVPLGQPARNAPKYFATVEIVTRMQDRVWLSSATKTVAKRWRAKNVRKRWAATAVTRETLT
jgi:hypothetical protein